MDLALSLLGMANALFFRDEVDVLAVRRGGTVMSDQLKTYTAYIVGLSILMFAWSVFKTWEPSVANQGVSVMQTTGAAAHTVAPERVAAE